VLDSVRWHLVHQKPFPLLALGVAGWMRYVGGVDEQGNAIEVVDPQLAVIQAAVNGSPEGENRRKRCWALRLSLAKSYRRKPFLWMR
jgi:fructuronate reductase